MKLLKVTLIVNCVCICIMVLSNLTLMIFNPSRDLISAILCVLIEFVNIPIATIFADIELHKRNGDIKLAAFNIIAVLMAILIMFWWILWHQV